MTSHCEHSRTRDDIFLFIFTRTYDLFDVETQCLFIEDVRKFWLWMPLVVKINTINQWMDLLSSWMDDSKTSHRGLFYELFLTIRTLGSPFVTHTHTHANVILDGWLFWRLKNTHKSVCIKIFLMQWWGYIVPCKINKSLK